MAVFFLSTITPTAITRAVVGLIAFFSVAVVYYLPAAAALSFNYSTFTPEMQNSIIRCEGDAYIQQAGWIDVTANRISSIGNSRGRASYNPEPMVLWDGATGEVASFTTRFSFVINYDDDIIPRGLNNKGTGMAFFLAAFPSSLPPGSAPYDMGLTNQSADAVAAGDGRFVAVEFDTFNDTAALDPDASYDHVGIDVNSIRSVATQVLPSFSLRRNMTAEITYDNRSSILALALWLNTTGDDDATGGLPPSYRLSHQVDLKSALPENVSVGFSGSTSTSIELHQLRSWYLSSSLEPKHKAAPPPTEAAPPLPLSPSATPSGASGGVIAGATVGASLFLVLLFAAAILARRRRRKNRALEEIGGVTEEDDDDDEPIVEIEMGAGAGPRRFSYHELAAATGSFAPEEKLGQGGFGSVYRGYLREQGLAVAIKRFAKGFSTQGRKEYRSEIRVISRLRHRNLVQLVGWCHGRDELLLVYELVPNRSLDVHLHGGGGCTFLTWPMRAKVLQGLGSALLYLHEEWSQCVVHHDVKPSNVMLDESFDAKLGDFGLARLIDHAVGAQTMTAASGTPGYVDPECLITGKASAESDVYSFGVVVLEVACGRRPMSLLGSSGAVFRLVEWAWDLYGQGAALAATDERLGGEYDVAEVERAVAVGLWCAHPDPRARPSIRAAMAALQPGGPPVPALPPRMPVPTYLAPVTPPEGLFSSTGMMTSSGSLTLTQSSAMTQTSYSSDASATSTGVKDSSSLLKHQY